MCTEHNERTSSCPSGKKKAFRSITEKRGSNKGHYHSHSLYRSSWGESRWYSICDECECALFVILMDWSDNQRHRGANISRDPPFCSITMMIQITIIKIYVLVVVTNMPTYILMLCDLKQSVFWSQERLKKYGRKEGVILLACEWVEVYICSGRFRKGQTLWSILIVPLTPAAG